MDLRSAFIARGQVQKSATWLHPRRKVDALQDWTWDFNLLNSSRGTTAFKHFMLGPPTKVKVSENLANRLNRNLYMERDRTKLSRRKARKRSPTGSTVYAQKVKLAPKQHMIVGCVQTKVSAFEKDWPSFIPQIKFQKSFAKNFRANLLRAKELLEAEQCLVKDFQIMVNAKGELFHLDFDRCFRSTGKKWHKGKRALRVRVSKRWTRWIVAFKKVLATLPNLLM